ncbi:MAG: methyltransferase domain-containing protein [Rubrivivax sp.]|nr:methyltransferase domain-containing protein [Rubrivivax sp.]
MSWNPNQYLKFAAPRLRPALDLLARVELDAPARVIDLGCGTGQLVRLMAQRWPAAHVLGVDASQAMLAKARAETATDQAAAARITWRQADLSRWQPEGAPPQLVYSNAALHWLPEHATLFPRLAQALAPGGVLAVQMPRNFSAPSHTAIADTVRAGPWHERLAPMLKESPVAEPAWYFDLLALHAAELDLWETEYLQVLTGADPVKEWTKGTWLAPFLAALASDDERAAFEADYAARVRAAYPPRADGRTLFPFRRLFIVARR